ncbi:MepB family protein [Silvanigrella sp.]|jgi:hypothetical protein|uniref:MepB family protein n=1 Tax=Silvanigrella sp. TaxID=2024976 RepID=UPI0037CCB37A|nr:MepB family protein [Silvanigrellaceae bacterium]
MKQNKWQSNPALEKYPLQLSKIIIDFVSNLNLKITKEPLRELESAEYGACQFEIENNNIIFRVAKTTPTKIGQFVTFWKRPSLEAEIAPYDLEDHFKFIMVFVFNDKNSGIFLFDKSILSKKGVISIHNKGGKRAIRVYPPWCNPDSKQAIYSQKWQCEYYISLDQITEKEITLFNNIFNT